MRIICFVLTLLLANVSFARTYTDTDFSYKNKNGNLVVWELQPKMLLYKGNTGYGVLSTEIVQDIVKEYSGSIKEISDYAAASRPQDRLGIWASNNANAYMIEFDNIRDTIKVLGKYEQMIPVIKDENGNLYFLSDGVRISVKQPSAIEAVNKYLESILHTPEFKLTPLISPGEYILHMDDYGVYRNSIYLSTTLSGYAFFSSVHPLMSPVEQVSVKVWLENNGAGTLGEERFLHCEITLPNSYKVSEEEEIAHLTFESVFDINPTVTAATFSSNLSMHQID
jgi:hypothetical protein